MQKEKKTSGFLNIISRMNESVVPVAVSALPARKEQTEEQAAAVSGVTEINIGIVEVNPEQPRKHFDEVTLNELAASIKKHGMIQPVVVAKKGAKYSIIAGERRFRAAIIAGLVKIPVVVKEAGERERREISLIENLQREELNPIEEAEAMRSLLEEYNLTQEELAASLGKSRPAVANAIRLLKLPAEIIEMVRLGKLSAGHARALLAIKDTDYQIKLAKEVILKKISVHELELRINQRMLKKAANMPISRLSLELRAFEADMQRLFATKVKIKGDDSKGKIQIEYYSKDELQKIYDLLEELKKD